MVLDKSLKMRAEDLINPRYYIWRSRYLIKTKKEADIPDWKLKRLKELVRGRGHYSYISFDELRPAESLYAEKMTKDQLFALLNRLDRDLPADTSRKLFTELGVVATAMQSYR